MIQLALAAATLAFQQAPVLPDPAPVVTPTQAPEICAPMHKGRACVTLTTSLGDIVIEVNTADATATANNFLAYADKGWLDGATFYRSMPYGDSGIAQFGVGRTDRLLDPVPHESTADTGLTHQRGTVSLISTEPGNGQADFFIALEPIPGFDASETFAGFAPFGQVVAGMDVVEAIFASPLDPEAGEGVMKGQMLLDPVEIESAERFVSSPGE